MAIGTTVKLGLDANAVRRGFAALPKMFGASMRGLRQVGIGAAQRVGHGMTDLLGRAVMAIPDGIKEMMDYAGTVNDMSAQTGVAIKDIVLLEEALRLSGAEARDTSRMLSTLKDNLFEATEAAGPARDALNKLGFLAGEFRGMKVDEAFRKIGMRVAELGPDFEGLEGIMADLFGARMGYKLIRFFRDFSGNMDKAKSNVGDFANRMQAEAGNIDEAGDALGRYRTRWMQLMEVIASAVGLGGGGDAINKAFDWLNPERVRGFIAALKQTFVFLRESITGFFKDGGFKGLFSDIGKLIGEGIKTSIGDLIPKNPFSGFFGKDKPASADRTTSQLLDINKQQARSLARIERSGFTAVLV